MNWLFAILSTFVLALSMFPFADALVAPPIGLQHTLYLNEGWNLLSFPVYNSNNCGGGNCAAVLTYSLNILENTCETDTIYHYDGGTYSKQSLYSGMYQANFGYWMKASKNCRIVISGTDKLSLVPNNLFAGWNQIGGEAVSFSDIKGDCQVTSGPYRYDTYSNSWVNEQYLQGGKGYFVKVSNFCTLGSDANPPIPPEGSITPTPAAIDLSNTPYKGDPNAKIEIIEYSDFQCPYCGMFYSQTLPKITANWINTGKAKLYFKQFPLSFHQNAQKAAEASECAKDQGKFWEMHNKLFENQYSLELSDLKRYAAEIGLDTSSFNYCLDNSIKASAVKSQFDEGTRNGLSGTPSFFINGQAIVGAQPYESFDAILKQYG